MTEPNPTNPDNFTPLRIDTTQPPVNTERMELFFIDGKAYTGPKVIPGHLALRALEVTVQRGSAAGAWFCLTEAIGQEAVDDLLACDQLTLDQARDFLTRISAMYYGQATGITGK